MKFAVFIFQGGHSLWLQMSEASQYHIAEEQNTIFTQKNRSHATEQKKWEYSLGKKWNYQYAKWILIRVVGKGRDVLACNDGNNRAVQTPERVKYHTGPFAILKRVLKLRGNLFRLRKELRLGNTIFIKQFLAISQKWLQFNYAIPVKIKAQPIMR